jgi:hypothetical protein
MQVQEHQYRTFLPWLRMETLNMETLSLNPNAMFYLEQHIDTIDWAILSSNPSAIDLLTQHMDNIHFSAFYQNPATIPYILTTIEDENGGEEIFPIYGRYHSLTFNSHPEAIAYLRKHFSDLHDANKWILCQNEGEMSLIQEHPEMINWNYLSANPAAISLLEQNPDKIHWNMLSRNRAAIHLLEQNLGKVDWSSLSSNPSAIHLLEKNQKLIDWNTIWANPAIVIYNYKPMEERCNLYKEELMMKMFHPRNYDKFVSWGFDEFKDE